ncbi:MAG: hypothetical protein EBU88_16240, partial [Acidobacteria bacterium]|nr:hypothetical protein [Acidobacteriota bacterium]
RIDNENYELYSTDIDTTFHLCNKNALNKDEHTHTIGIRVAGNFTAKHLPWYRENLLLNIYENYKIHTLFYTSNISSIRRILLNYINTNFHRIDKHQEYFFIPNDTNLGFWKDVFPGWKNETFDVLNQFLNKDKIFIDVGAWIGAISLYASRFSSHVYSIGADAEAVEFLRHYRKLNCRNVTIIDDKESVPVVFGSSVLSSLLQEYTINPKRISLLRVDINGCEENLLDDLYSIHVNHYVPLYITFHYCSWTNDDLDRFAVVKMC